MVVAACNNARGIDPAITRAGRLDRMIEIPMPGEAALEGILRFHLGDDLLADDLGQIAMRLRGLSGADVERLVRVARRRARYAGRELLIEDLTAEMSVTERTASDELRRRAAVHEAGHAVLAELQRPGQLLRLVVGGHGENLGLAEYAPEREVEPQTIEEVSRRLQRILAGRAAEILVFGNASGGGGGGDDSDLGRATWLALTAITTLGLDPERRSLVWMGARDAMGAASLLSIRPDLQRAVNRMLAAAQDGAIRILSIRKVALTKVAEALDQRGTLAGDEVRAILGEDGAKAVKAERPARGANSAPARS